MKFSVNKKENKSQESPIKIANVIATELYENITIFVEHMKYLSLILALLILGMAMMPCSDGHTCDETSQEISLEHDHSEDEKDHCSPFCVCPCCGINISLVLRTSTTKPNPLLNSNRQFNYSNLYSFSFNQAVWHPPTFC